MSQSNPLSFRKEPTNMQAHMKFCTFKTEQGAEGVIEQLEALSSNPSTIKKSHKKWRVGIHLPSCGNSSNQAL
jgi:hypothetical protein